MPGLEFDQAGIAIIAVARASFVQPQPPAPPVPLPRNVYAKNCRVVYQGNGIWEITLDDGEGIVDAETFILATLLETGVPGINSEIETFSHPTDPRKKYVQTLDSQGNPAERGWNAFFGRTTT